MTVSLAGCSALRNLLNTLAPPAEALLISSKRARPLALGTPGLSVGPSVDFFDEEDAYIFFAYIMDEIFPKVLHSNYCLELSFAQ